jgi:hypothetical protein
MMKLSPPVGSIVYVRPITERAIKTYGSQEISAEVIKNFDGLPEAYKVKFSDGSEHTFVGRFVDLTV